MPTLRVIVDDVLSPNHDGEGRYAEELTRQLIATAPRGSFVSGITAVTSEEEHADLRRRLPGLNELYTSPLSRRQLAAAWQHGFNALPGKGLIHATSLLAPLRRHDRASSPESQIAVTIHDALAWTHPESLPPATVRWQRAMGRRAERYADAVVVPTHAVAAVLSDHLRFDDRVRVIGGAAPRPVSPADIELPERYLLTTIGASSESGFTELLTALDDPQLLGLPLHVIVPAGVREPDEHPRVTSWIAPTEQVQRALFERATVFVSPTVAEGFWLPLLQAMAVGTPVVHSDAPALSEVAAGAGVEVVRADADGYPFRLATAVAEVLDDPELQQSLRVSGIDRAHAFSWRDSAEKVWQLHADL